jgi:hypothetical protein
MERAVCSYILRPHILVGETLCRWDTLIDGVSMFQKYIKRKVRDNEWNNG